MWIFPSRQCSHRGSCPSTASRCSTLVEEEGEKHIVWFHDESAYNTIKDTPVLREEKGKLPIKPKGKGSSIMVSEFIEEKDGYLALSDEQYEFEVTIVVMVFRSLPLPSWRSERTVGYWNDDRFMEQVAKALKIAEVKYPSSQGYHHIWCFDHSCNHTAFVEDALIYEGHPFPSNFLPFPFNFHFHTTHLIYAHAYTQRHESL